MGNNSREMSAAPSSGSEKEAPLAARNKFSHVDYSGLPEHMRDGARLYIEYGVEPGSFMSAVICNDLREAMGRADSINRERLFDIVCWFHNEAPSMSWGSREKMRAWVSAREAERVESA